MTLPILLIFYVSKRKNNKKHWKIGILLHCDVIIGRGKSKLGVGLLCTEVIIVCKFHDPSIIGSRDTEGGSEEPPPVTDWPKKPSLNRVNALDAKCIGWSPCMRQAPIPLFQPLRSISAAVGFIKAFCLFYSQINELLFFSRALSGSDLAKRSSEKRER